MSEPHYSKFRQNTPSQYQKWISRYDIPSEELQNLAQQQPQVVFTQTFALDTTQTFANPLVINQAGRGFQIQGIQNGTVYDPVANTGIETVIRQAFTFVRINDDRLSNGIPVKHGRGYIGTFNKLFISWPSQGGVTARLIIFKFDFIPWFSGDSPT